MVQVTRSALHEIVELVHHVHKCAVAARSSAFVTFRELCSTAKIVSA